MLSVSLGAGEEEHTLGAAPALRSSAIPSSDSTLPRVSKEDAARKEENRLGANLAQHSDWRLFSIIDGHNEEPLPLIQLDRPRHNR